MTDRDYLRLAQEAAGQSAEPVPCGCVIVRNGKIIAREYNSQRVDEVAVHHAEVKAVYQANRKLKARKLTGATAYCSCEPCAMCLVALALADVERIVYGQTMREAAPSSQLAGLDSRAFAEKYLDSIPQLEQLLV